MKTCVFCNVELTKSNRSKKHVIPRWLQENRGIPDEVLSAGFGDSSGITIQRRLDMDSFLAGNVCTACNNGWMNDLEVDTRDILIRLLDRLLSPKQLNDDDLLQLAKWNVKTAIACNSALPGDPKIDPSFVKQFGFARGRNLGTCGVFAGFLNIPNRFGYIQITADNPMLVGQNPAQFCVALYLDRLFLITVIAAKGLGYTFELVENVHIPIWPGRGHEFRKDQHSLPLTGTEGDLKTVTDALQVRYRFEVT